jgi:hypothetical protein
MKDDPNGTKDVKPVYVDIYKDLKKKLDNLLKTSYSSTSSFNITNEKIKNELRELGYIV